MLSFGKLVDLGFAAPHVYVMYQNIPVYDCSYSEYVSINH